MLVREKRGANSGDEGRKLQRTSTQLARAIIRRSHGTISVNEGADRRARCETTAMCRVLFWMISGTQYHGRCQLTGHAVTKALMAALHQDVVVRSEPGSTTQWMRRMRLVRVPVKSQVRWEWKESQCDGGRKRTVTPAVRPTAADNQSLGQAERALRVGAALGKKNQ